MGRVFVSYRRSDTADFCGRLCDRLRSAFGGGVVYVDVVSLGPGERWRHELEQAIRRCDVVLVLIGPKWLEVIDEDQRRRIEDPDDVVRAEIEIALEREGPLVVPTLVGGARMPTPDDLPDSIRSLVEHNAIKVRSDEGFDNDVRTLIERLFEWLVPRRLVRRSIGVLITMIGVVGILGGFGGFAFGGLQFAKGNRDGWTMSIIAMGVAFAGGVLAKIGSVLARKPTLRA